MTSWQSWDLESYCAFYYRGEKSQVLVSDFSSTSSLPPFKIKVLGIKYEIVTQPPPVSLHLAVWHSSFMVRWRDLSCLLPLSFLRTSFCFWWYDKYFIPVVTAYQVLQLSFHHYHHHCFRAFRIMNFLTLDCSINLDLKPVFLYSNALLGNQKHKLDLKVCIGR